MYSLEIVLIAIAVTFVAAWILGFRSGDHHGKTEALMLLSEEELRRVAKRLGISLRNIQGEDKE